MAIGIPFDGLSVGQTGSVSSSTRRQDKTERAGGGFLKQPSRYNSAGRYDQLPQYRERKKTAKQMQIDELQMRVDVLRQRLAENPGDKTLSAELSMVQAQLFWLQNSY